MITDLYNKENEKIGTVELRDAVFSQKWNPDLVNQVILAQLSNRRQPLAHTKGRGDVSGGGKKPYAQKHTGRSRQGSSRSPLWKGGGVTFGPTKERNFIKKINKKMREVALSSLLSRKLKDGEVKIIDDLSLQAYKTKLAAHVVKQLIGKSTSVLFVPAKEHALFSRAGRNIPQVAVLQAPNLNVYDCASHKFVILEKNALNEIPVQSRLNK
ncbi:MAG: 50S ribosomal protein L4 [Candidatus Jorgensenbacteria bacterium]|nr:50S ribosomal protein L4 [Candidatus Jorgensenbacteria bacterium]